MEIEYFSGTLASERFSGGHTRHLDSLTVLISFRLDSKYFDHISIRYML